MTDTHPLAGAVKPLEWEYHPAGAMAAPATGHAYIIDTRTKGRCHSIKGFNPQRDFDTLEAAKSAAQDDYERRILSALSAPTPPADVAGLVERMRGDCQAYSGERGWTGILRRMEQAADALTTLSARVAELEGERGWQTVAESNQQMAQSWQARAEAAKAREKESRDAKMAANDDAAYWKARADALGKSFSEDLFRFFSKVAQEGECLAWQGRKQGRGYGKFLCGGKSHQAHRWIFQAIYGEVGADMDVCHTCDNPKCVNPMHLFSGSRSDNMTDCAKKGRNIMQKHPERNHFKRNRYPQRGEKHGGSLLKESDIADITALSKSGMSSSQIAEKKGVSAGHIRKILSGKAWSHLPAAIRTMKSKP